mmetsp:Transcript_30672/g.97951  ORF Transcript_30672/g.97951 Transcript_30672/m.97951 type:complete len:200 (+) Transcript_30672:199-798(+)
MVARQKKTKAAAAPAERTAGAEGGALAAPGGGAAAREPSASEKRKVVKKQKFLDKLMAGPSNLSAVKSIGKNKNKRKKGQLLKDLSSLLEDLPDVEGVGGKIKLDVQPKVLTSRGRSKLTTRETGRIQQVLAHPQFLQGPTAALQAHLNTILPPAPEPQPPEAKKKPLDAEAKRRLRKTQKLKRQLAKELGEGTHGMQM